MKVCIFTETYFPEVGGGETQARLLADGLIASGHSVVILTRRSNQASPRFELVRGIPVYRLPPSGGGQLKKWGLILASLPWLVQMRHHYDLLFVSGYRIIGISAVLACKLLNKRCVLKADSQGEMSGRFFWPGLVKLGIAPAGRPFALFLWLRNRVLRHADAFTAITDDIAMELRAAPLSASQLHLIPNGVDTTRFCPVEPGQKARLRAALDLPHGAPVAVYTGRLVSYKGLPLLLRVWSQLHRAHPKAVLVLAGVGGLDIHNCEAELKAYVALHGLGRVIRFVGGVGNVHEYLQAADLFVFPTENDAFPSSLIEAMACALPVATTHIGAIRTVVTDGQTGLVVAPGDAQHLYQALDKLLSDPALGRRLGLAARQTVEAHYSASRVTAAYVALFHAISRPGAGVALPSAQIEDRQS